MAETKEKRGEPKPDADLLTPISEVEVNDRVLYWFDIKGELVPYAAILTYRNKMRPDEWNLYVFPPTGIAFTMNGKRRSDRPQAGCWTLKS